MRVDIAIYDRLGQIGMVVEVKAVRQTNALWAREYCTNLLFALGEVRPAFLMIVARDYIYVWDRAALSSKPVAAPTRVLATPDQLAGIFQRIGLNPETISGRGFEDVVATWLEETIAEFSQQDVGGGPTTWAVETGVDAILKNARIQYEQYFEPVY